MIYFMTSAIACGSIMILSDGTPRRPLIHIHDVARAIEWGVNRESSHGGNFLTVNVGSDQMNYQLKDLAEEVAEVIPNVDVRINADAQPDRRSYRVSFSKFSKLAPYYAPKMDLRAAIEDMRDGLAAIRFADPNFRDSKFIRLSIMNRLKATHCLTDDIEWTHWGDTRYPPLNGNCRPVRVPFQEERTVPSLSEQTEQRMRPHHISG
jgi:hypothetical protein